MYNETSRANLVLLPGECRVVSNSTLVGASCDIAKAVLKISKFFKKSSTCEIKPHKCFNEHSTSIHGNEFQEGGDFVGLLEN